MKTGLHLFFRPVYASHIKTMKPVRTIANALLAIALMGFFILPHVVQAQTSCCTVGSKVRSGNFIYTGANCGTSSNNQGTIGGKWDCSGDANADPQVYIVVNTQSGTGLGGTIYFQGNVNLNESFFITAGPAGQLANDTYFHILNQQGGTQIQVVKIHFSCSAPIVPGDTFGSVTMVNVTMTNNVVCGPQDPCDIFTPTITGSNAICEDNIVPTTLTATGGGSYIWSTGETTASIQVAPTSTTTYTVTVTSVDNCTNTASKTVQIIPCSGQICFNGNNNVSATANWTIVFNVNPANDLVKIRATLSKNFVDNTYGTNAIGWPSGHTFNQLVGSDHLILSMLDGNNVKRMEVKMDYISATSAAPSGYKSLGVLGGDGSMILGSSSDVLNVVTSLDVNFNQFGYVLTTNSPSTNSSYLPNPTYPNWIYDVWYEIDVKLSAFGAAGFGKVGITGVHASPSKTGNNTEIVTEGPCCELQTRITGNDTICSGQSTTLTAISSKSLKIVASEDTEIWNKSGDEAKNYGNCNILYINGIPIQRALLKFNLASIPINAEIVSSNLGMVKVGGSNDAININAHRITNSWTEGTGSCSGTAGVANFLQRNSGVNWNTPGGDFSAAPEYTTNVSANGGYFWTLTDLVNGWVNGTIPNHGVLLKFANENVNEEMDFASSENSTTGNRPTLTVNYFDNTPPTGNVTFKWNTGATTPSINVSPSQTTTYTVTITDSEGCSGTSSITVNVSPQPTVDAGVDPLICIGQTVILTANASNGTPPYSYTWNNPSSTGASKTVSPTTNTTYTVTVTDSFGCSATDNVTVIVGTPPPASAINDGPLTCTKTSVTLTANPATGVSYLWSNGATTRTVNVNMAGTYTVTVTDLNSDCSATASTTVLGDTTNPTVELGPDVTVNCFNASATLTAVVSGATSILWNTGQTTSSIAVSPEVTTVYSITVTASNGCTATDQITVTANKAKPTAGISATGNNCITQNAQLFGSATGGTSPYTFAWGGPNGFSSQLQNPFITDNGTYTLTVTDVNGCTDTESIVIFSEFLPIVIAITTEICVGETVTLTASGGVSYQWGPNANNATTASIMVSPTTTTSYSVTVTSAQGCVGSGSATITVYDNPQIVDLLTTPNSSCNNTGNTGSITVIATGQAGLTLQYRINGGPWQLSNVFNNLGNGVYNVEVSYTTRLCTTPPAQATIISSPGLVAVAENDKTVCPSTPFTLTATAQGGTPPFTFNWSNGMSGSTINIAGILTNTTYTVTVTDSKGCTATDIVLVSIFPPVITDLFGPDQVCTDEFAFFSVNPLIPNATYFWDFNGGISADGDNDDSSESVKWPAIYQNTTRTVTLVITKDGCPTTFSKSVLVKRGPFLNTPGSYDVCQGGSVQIGPNPNDPNQVTPGSSFLWTPNLFLNSNTVAQPVSSPPFDIVYTLTATVNGCVETRQVTVNVDVSLNPIADAGPDKTICLGSNVVIGGNPTATPPPGGAIQGVVWIPAAGLNNPLLHNPTASPTINTQYQVIVVATSGCADTAIVNVFVDPLPQPALTATPPAICAGSSSQLVANATGGTPPYTFNWSNGLGTGTSKTVSPAINTTYTITVTDFKGCTASTNVTVIVRPTPVVNVTATPSTICRGETTQLTATGSGGTGPYTYAWSNGLGSGATKNVSPTITTTYFVTVTDANFCTGTGSVTVTVLQKAKIGDFVWEDSNINGLQDPGEPGLGGVSVGLYLASNNSLVASTTTDAQGFYEFEVCPGTYYVVFGTLQGYLRTLQDVGANDNIDSDANPATGQTGNYTLTSGQINSTVDAGLYRDINIDLQKNFVSAIQQANGTFNVTYTISVTNNGGATLYDLLDTPLFDDDISINSASYTSNAPGNAGGPLAGSGPWVLGNDVSIAFSAVHTYTLFVNVTLNLTDAIGNNIYTRCGQQTQTPVPGQGLYNRVGLDVNNDGTPEYTDFDCGDVPNVVMRKDLTNVVANPNGTYTVNYSIIVTNNGGTTGQYSLKDTPLFENDVTILSGSFSGQASGSMNTSGTTQLATNLSINAGAVHIYNVSFVVTINLDPGSNDPGDNIYTACAVSGNGPGSAPGQGLYNRAELDRTGDGVTDITDDACGEVPFVTMRKDLVNVITNANGTFTVNYAVLVTNIGGATGQYSLKDTPLFENDVTILSGSFSGQANGAMNTSGSTQLATNTSIGAGVTHIYNVSFNVTLNLEPGSPDGGDNIYTACAVAGNGPGSGPGQGLYNRAELDRNGDGITDLTDDACGDVPYVTMRKDIVSVSPNANGTFNVSYAIYVRNTGCAAGQYSLKDTPLFDNDVIILSGNFSGHASGPMNITGSTQLANNTSIASGTEHIYNVTFVVRLNLEPGSPDGGDNIYTPCLVSGNGPGSGPGQGLYNRAELDRTGDSITDITDDACGDVPYITLRKDLLSVTPQAGAGHRVVYSITVQNIGGADGQYTLTDSPLFDNDVTITAWDYTFVDVGAGFGNGPTFIGAPPVPINFGTKVLTKGNTHIYTLGFNVVLDLGPGSNDPGDNIYTPCAVQGSNSGSSPGQGLYNRADLDWTGDGIPDLNDDACGNVPFVTMRKDLVSVITNSNGTYTVNYAVIVTNTGGATGQYSLRDTPLFDNDVTILSGSFSGQASGSMNTTGPTQLATDVSINAGATHIYNVSFNVTLNLDPGSNDPGDNIYTPCAVAGNGPGSGPGQGLYNRAELDRNGDGITDLTDDACGDLPFVNMRKDIVSVTANANGTYTVNYAIIVSNVGGATGQYSLKDIPLFDNDVTILSGSFSGQANGIMNVVGFTQLANNVAIAAGATHIYNVSFIVNLNLDPGSPDGGDNIYTPCAVAGNGPGSGPGQGLYNRAELDRNGDGITDLSDDACGDLPFIIMRKDLVNVTPNQNGTYTVRYAIIVNNIGGATGRYSLRDIPLFDNDVTILSGNFSGQASGNMNTSGYTTLANNVFINAGAMHLYNVSFVVTIDLSQGSDDPGDNIYTPCAVPGNGPGSGPGQGLYNRAELDRTGDDVTDITDDACGDLPFVTMVKNFVSVVPGQNNNYTVNYTIIVSNIGGAAGQYSLKDTPLFDDDVVILSGSFSGQANGVMNIIGSTQLANNVFINAGATHVYNVSFVVRLDLTPEGSQGGDNIYTPCEVSGNGPGSSPGEGLYNLAELDRTGDGITDVFDDACGDLPGAIGDFVWEDLNLNGIQDPGEQGIRNVLVRLLNQGGSIIRSAITDVNGFYLFDNLAPGTYSVQFTTPVGYFPTLDNRGANDAVDSDPNPITGITQQYVLGPGEFNLTVDAGFYRLASIGDFVWEDFNANGIQDAFEPGIPNVTVLLTGTNALGNPVNLNTTTNAMGMYAFNNLVPGTYTVTFVRPGAQYLSSPANSGLNDAVDSDADPVTGTTGVVVLQSNENNTTVDAGYYRCAKVGDFVWLDTGTGENVQDPLDIGLNNIPVDLYLASNPPVLISSQTTRNNPSNGTPGYYLFDCVPPGVYFIKVRKPVEYDFVTPNFGLDDMIDSDIVDFINERTLDFTVSYAQIILDIDIGLKFRVLPVEFEDFTGRWNTDKDVNELDWITASELNNDYFEVQRSFGGSDFEVIAVVDGKGSSNTRSFYQFDDKDIARNGVYSYRLRQVDLDGKFTYSKIVDIHVNRKLSAGARIYPNPANSHINVDITGSEGAKVELDVYDNSGRLVMKNVINTILDSGRLESVVPLERLDPGVYMVKFRIDAEIFNQKLIIVR